MKPDPDLSIPLTLGRSLWAIDPEALPRLAAAHRSRHLLSRLEAPAATSPKAARRSASSTGGSVAVIPLTGIISPRMSFLSWLFGGGTLLDFRDAFRQAVNSPDVKAILLDVDSPGGLVSLVPETAQEIYEARGEKPIVAIANTMAASAAYWIASQADEVVVTPSGFVGSIGVYLLHEDWSKFNEDFGVDPTYVFAGEHKIDGNPDEPLADDVKADWQQEVDDLYGMFAASVAAARGTSEDAVRTGYGQGRVLLANRALEAGLVDRVATFEEVLGELLVPGGGAGAGRASRLLTFKQARAELETDDEPQDDPDDVAAPAETPEDEPEQEREDAPAEDEPQTPAESEDEPAPAAPDAAARAAFADALA